MLRSSKSGRAAYQSPRPRPIKGEQGGTCHFKAQPQESRTLPSRAPTTLLQAGSRGQACTPPPRLGEREPQPGRPRAHNPSQPGRCSSLFPLPPHNLASSRLCPTIGVITTQGSDLAHVCCLLIRWYGEKRGGVEKTTGFRHWLMQSDAELALRDSTAFRQEELT